MWLQLILSYLYGMTPALFGFVKKSSCSVPSAGYQCNPVKAFIAKLNKHFLSKNAMQILWELFVYFVYFCIRADVRSQELGEGVAVHQRHKISGIKVKATIR